MGGGGFTSSSLPSGAAIWCSGDDVVQSLNDLFHQNPSNQQYQDAKNASLDDFQTAATSGLWTDLWGAYSNAYSAAGVTLCSGWSLYLKALGTMGAMRSTIATTASTANSSAILTFGSVPDWMANGMSVSDSTTQGGINGAQTVSSFTANTVTLSANVNATVNSGDTIVFSLPAGIGLTNIRAIAQARYNGLFHNKKMKTFKHLPHDPHSSGHAVKVKDENDGSITINSPYIPPNDALKRRGLGPTTRE
jgi:hypothetical protein